MKLKCDGRDYATLPSMQETNWGQGACADIKPKLVCCYTNSSIIDKYSQLEYGQAYLTVTIAHAQLSKNIDFEKV